MAVDWFAIKNDYINGGGSYRELAEKHSVSIDSIKKKAAAEKWKDERTAFTQNLHQKTKEKTIDTLSDEAVAKARIRVRLLLVGENWLNNLEEITDTNVFRRMVQSFADMGVFEKNVSEYAQGTQSEDDPLTKSLKEEAERLNNADQ